MAGRARGLPAQVRHVRHARSMQERLRKRSEAQDLAAIKAALLAEKARRSCNSPLPPPRPPLLRPDASFLRPG